MLFVDAHCFHFDFEGFAFDGDLVGGFPLVLFLNLVGFSIYRDCFKASDSDVVSPVSSAFLEQRNDIGCSVKFYAERSWISRCGLLNHVLSVPVSHDGTWVKDEVFDSINGYAEARIVITTKLTLREHLPSGCC